METSSSNMSLRCAIPSSSSSCSSSSSSSSCPSPSACLFSWASLKTSKAKGVGCSICTYHFLRSIHSGAFMPPPTAAAASPLHHDPGEDDKVVHMVRNLDTLVALRMVDRELGDGNDRKALAIVNALRSRPEGGLRGFGASDQIPKRIYSLEDLRLNNIEPSRFLSPVDLTLGAVRSNLQLAALLGAILIWQTQFLDHVQVFFATITFLLIGTMDQIANAGGIEALVLDSLGRLINPKYKKRVALHEAGHFLIAYFLGILPKNYLLSSFDAFRKEGSLNVQAGTSFVDFAFEEEVKSGKLSSEALDKYTCIALAGVASEYLAYGVAEGGLSDIQQLDRLLKGLKFSQLKADSQVRWAVLNVVILLRRHQKPLTELAVAMDSGKSIGDCISTIEENLVK